MTAVPVLEVSRGAAAFRVTRGEYDRHWEKYAAGRWEPAMLDVFDRFIGPDTTVLDLGAWIGPATLYAARRAKRVVALEPDPVAFGMLAGNLAANPDIGNVELVQACVATRDGTLRLGVDDRPGDAESSILFGGEGAGWDVAAIRLDRVIAERRIARPLFIKMDIEGYEFELVPTILDILREPGTILHLSTHPHIFRDREGHRARTRLGRSIRKRAFGLVPAVKAWLRLAGALDSWACVYDEAGTPVRLGSRLFSAALGRGPTVVVSPDPLGWEPPRR